MKLSHRIMAGMLMVFAAGSVAAQAQSERLQPVNGAVTGVGEAARWTIDQDARALLSLDLPTPGLLSVVVQADNGVDVQLTVADAMGVPYVDGYFDNDPPALKDGESGALLLPAGRVNVVVASWGVPTSGSVRTAWMPLPDAEPTPVASQAFIECAAIADDLSVVMMLHPKKLPGDRTVLYLSPRTAAGTIGLTFDPPLGDRVLMALYASDQPWLQTFDFEQGVGTLDLRAAAGVGHFLVLEHWEDQTVPLKLTRRDVGPVGPGPQSADPDEPAAPAATRRAPR